MEVARNAGVPAHLIGDAEDIQPAWLEGLSVAGLTAGASVPESLVDRVIGRMAEMGFSEVQAAGGIPEEVQFALPSELVRDARAQGILDAQEKAPRTYTATA